MSRSDAGSSMVEVLVALTLLVLVSLGAAQLSVVSSRVVLALRHGTVASSLALQKLEQLRALTWAVGDDGSFQTDVQTDVSRDPAVYGGAGAAAPAGSLVEDRDGYVDFLDARGRWVAAGGFPPPGAAFTRRWALELLAASGGEYQVLRVLVTPAAHATRTAATAGAVLGTDAALVAIRSRSGR
jgi:hypothetical protein